MEAHFRAKYPKAPEDSDGVYRSVIRAKALDTLRGLLPAATQSNVGLFGTGQAFEALLLRMCAHPLDEVRGCAAADARRAAPGDPGVPRPRRSAGPRRPLDRVPRRHARRDVRAAAAAAARRRRRPSRATKSRSPTSIPTARSRSSPRRSTPCPTLPDDQLLAIARAHVGRRSRRAAARLRRRARQPPPQARARVRAHQLPLRRPRRLRRLPRSAAPSAADARVAAAQRRATATPSRRRSTKPARSPTGAR